jgi:hypothetical protein
VTVTVSAIATSLVVSPASATVAPDSITAFTGVVHDQFDMALVTQPILTWTVSDGGSIDNSGVFTAGSTAGGPYVIRATTAELSKAAPVTISTDVASASTGGDERNCGWGSSALGMLIGLVLLNGVGLRRWRRIKCR